MSAGDDMANWREYVGIEYALYQGCLHRVVGYLIDEVVISATFDLKDLERVIYVKRDNVKIVCVN